MSEWKSIQWGDVATLEYGKSLKGYQDSTGHIPVFGTNGRIGFTDRALCEQAGIIIGRKGAYRGVHFSSGPFFVIDTAFYLDIKRDNEVDIAFAYYNLLTKNINALDSGSAIPSTSRDDFYGLDLRLPPLHEQKSIAAILSVLDNKINLLRRQNETLEKIAQTLFRYWFVDFEFPDEQGNPYKSSGGKMIDSELGEIPDGWSFVEMQSLIDVKDGTHDSPKQNTTGFPLVTSKHLKPNGIDFDSTYLVSEEDYNNINKRSKVETGDILLSMIGTVGILYFVQEKVNFCIKNIGLFKTSQNLALAEYVFLYLNSNYGRHYFISRMAGTTQSYLTLGSLRDLPVLISDDSILRLFRNAVKPVYSSIHKSNQQIQTLTKLRDTLLPKLMSGQLRVREAERETPVQMSLNI